MNLEIERKYLLRTLPEAKWDKILFIEQRYFFDEKENNWVRLRLFNDKKKDSQNFYCRTVKRKVGEFTWEEDEKMLSFDEFSSLVLNYRIAGAKERVIAKDRFILNHQENTWEVDMYRDMHLITAEIELPSEAHIFSIPEGIKNQIILEISGMNEFSNKKLATKLNY